MSEIIEKYLDENIGLSSIKKLWEKLKDKGYNKNEIKQELNKTKLHQMTSNNNKYHRFPIIPKEPYSYQMDLTFYDDIKRFNGGISSLLSIIEISSRKAFIYPLKKKTQEEIYQALEDFVNKNIVNKLYCDNGNEFNNKKIKRLAQENEIELVFSQPYDKTSRSIIERFNRTIRDLISKYLLLNGTKRYIDILPKLVDNYNNSYHSSINRTPNNFYENIENDFDKYVKSIYDSDKYKKALSAFEKLKPGDKVRILENKQMFQKGQRLFSANIYKIIGIDGYKFILRNENGDKLHKHYKHWELKKIDDDIIDNKQLDEKTNKEYQNVKLAKKIKRNTKLDVNEDDLNKLDEPKRYNLRTRNKIK